jgi:hypothetical protein
MCPGSSCADSQSAFLFPSYGRYDARAFFNQFQFSTALALKSLIEFTKRFDFSPRSMSNTLHPAVSGFDKQRNVGSAVSAINSPTKMKFLFMTSTSRPVEVFLAYLRGCYADE